MQVYNYFMAMWRGLMFWRRQKSIETLPALATFCATRAAFIGQSSLYNYLRARAGLQHFNLFNDAAFLAMLRPARTRLVLVCLADLSIFASSLMANSADKSKSTLARILFQQAVAQIDTSDITDKEMRQALDDFEAQLANFDWAAPATSAFTRSPQALIDLAPVVDVLKELDDEIVQNSMRFKWREIRTELAACLNRKSVLAELARYVAQKSN